MVIAGTYTIVKSPAVRAFYDKMGIDKDIADKLVGSHWNVTVWNEGPQQWGYYFTCQELPEFNMVDVVYEDVEKEVDQTVFGGKTKFLFKRDGDSFLSTFDSEKCGKYSSHETYTQEGIKIVWTIQDVNVEEFWCRTKEWAGSFVTQSLTNIDDFFAGMSEEFIANAKNYKTSVWQVGNEFKILEDFGSSGQVPTTFKLDEPTPLYIPGEDSSVPTERRATLSKNGHGNFLMVVNNPDGKVEEWTFSYSCGKLKLHGKSLDSGKECSYDMEKVVNINGLYSVAASNGFENFAKGVGFSEEMIEDFKNSKNDSRILFKDLGDGVQEHGYKSPSVDFHLKVKLDEEFEFYHPFLKENVKALGKMNGNVLNFDIQTSKGQVKETDAFFDNFVFGTMTHVDSNSVWTIIYEKV